MNWRKEVELTLFRDNNIIKYERFRHQLFNREALLRMIPSISEEDYPFLARPSGDKKEYEDMFGRHEKRISDKKASESSSCTPSKATHLAKPQPKLSAEQGNVVLKKPTLTPAKVVLPVSNILPEA